MCDSLGVSAADLRDDVALNQHAVSGRPYQHLAGGERGVRPLAFMRKGAGDAEGVRTMVILKSTGVIMVMIQGQK